MKLSTKGRYGIHAMYDLAVNNGGAPQPLKAIAERQSMPEPYLEQLMLTLRRSGLVASARGAQGGYKLSRPPGEITVGQVLRALEGEMHLADCLMGEDACARAEACPTRVVWAKLRDGINGIIDSITLQDMINDQARLSVSQES